MIANVEIRLLPREEKGYPVEFEVEIETGKQQWSGYAAATFPPLSAASSKTSQGQRLWQWLMADPTLQRAWDKLSGQYPERRIRLRLDAAAPELHLIPWELLHDGTSHLAASVNTPFSRYLAGEWRPQPPISDHPIRILVAIANPENLERFNLQAVDADKEWALIHTATADHRFKHIRLEPPITLNKIEAVLEQGYHILHLVGHGSYNEKQETAFLYLADEQNQAKPVRDEEFVAMLQRRLGGVDAVAQASLRLVYLSSCQSASRSQAQAFRGLAPQLIQAGISAVVAMQDLMSVVTAQAFARTFYERLAAHGLVDAAANSARSHLLTAGLPGVAIPVLFSRLKDNQLIAPQQDSTYKEDIGRLKRLTAQSVSLTRKFSRIRMGSEEIAVKRQCLTALKAAVKDGSIVVGGEPGVGKSGVLHELVTDLVHDYDVVFITVDSVEADSLKGISDELRLSHDIVEVLTQWEGEKPGFVIIDALDAARLGQKVRAVNKLITRIKQEATRWHVVVSIRKFDLRYGPEIQELFEGTSPTSFQDPEFTNVQHINIPAFDDDELHQIVEQSPLLRQLVSTATTEFRDLLRVPFTLNLAAKLLTSGIDLNDLTSISTQIELLEKYWASQVIRADGYADKREALLRKILRLMVADQTMIISRSSVIDSVTIDVELLHDLLSYQILAEGNLPTLRQPDREILTFSHHIIYDYAAAKLLLRGTDRDFTKNISRHKEWALTIRPSLVLHFQYLWQQDKTRERFWKLTLLLATSVDIPAIAKIIAPGVAVQFVKTITDFEPLLAELLSPQAKQQDAVRYVLNHVISIFDAETADKQYPVTNMRTNPWPALAERLSKQLDLKTSILALRLLRLLLEPRFPLLVEHIHSCGVAARNLLVFAWEQPLRISWLTVDALGFVCQTFSSDPGASAQLIRRALNQEQLERFGYEEMPRVAKAILAVIPHAPELVKEIYEVVFKYQEKSREETYKGGQIVSLISNKSQDYSAALYRLTEAFPDFLRNHPDYAVQALISIVKSYVYSSHYPVKEYGSVQQKFTFRGYETYMIRDYSSTWDRAPHGHDYTVKMLDAFSDCLNELAVNSSDTNVQIIEIINSVAQYNRLAALWKRLLVAGTTHPRTIGLEIKALAWSYPLLFEGDTFNEASTFISVIYPLLTTEERVIVEQTILSTREFNSRERANLLCSFFFQNIPYELIALNEAKQVLAEVAIADAHEDISKSKRELPDWLGQEIIDLRTNASPVEMQVLDLTDQLREFIKAAKDREPSVRNVEEIFPHLRVLLTTLVDAKGITEEITQLAVNELIAVSERIASIDEFDCSSEVGEFVKSTLSMASTHREPTYNIEQEAGFDRSISWVISSPRISAANGLILIARHQTCIDEMVQDAIIKLSKDLVASVRFQIARNCNTIYESAPQLMWQLIEQFTESEQSRGVLQGLLRHPFNRLIDSETDRIIEATEIIFKRIREGNGSDEVQGHCASLFLYAYLFCNHTLSGQIIREITENPIENQAAVQRLLLNLRDSLSVESAVSTNTKETRIRHKALLVFTRIVQSIKRQMEQIIQRDPQEIFTDLDMKEQEQIRGFVRLIDTLTTEVYFASGAFEEKQSLRKGQVVSLRERQRFLEDFIPILEELLWISGIRLFGHGFASMTHRIIETLEFIVPAEPSAVFQWLHRYVLAAKETEYQFESLAVTQIVDMVRLYLAQYREVIQAEHQHSLIEMLDIFIEIGDPRVIQLSHSLDEIFR